MSQGSAETKESSVGELLVRAFAAIREHRLEEALGTLEDALALDFDNDEVISSLKYVNFWQERQHAARRIEKDVERGEYLLSQWKPFIQFAKGAGGEPCERCLFALRHHVFGGALELFQGIAKDNDDGDLLWRLGRCHKGLGNYEKAVSFMEEACVQKRDDPAMLAELADCYAMVNNVQKSKAFFREAFFLGPDRIDLSSLESGLIRRLIEKVEELGYQGAAVAEWVPVYGVVFGVFTVKRELRSIEYGKLKQSIYALEREHGEAKNPEALLTPRLVNRYFWLIDHYVHSEEDPTKIDDVLLRIRSVSPEIYQQYVN
jgi:tetratricopeptide (TPR) repeat protein